MKKRIILITITLIGLIIVGCMSYTKYHQTVGNRIYKEVTQSEEFKENGTYSKQIKLSDYTNFEWDSVCVFMDCMPGMYSKEENCELFENCHKRLNYNTGFVFLKNGKIVKYERFKADFDASTTLETKFFISSVPANERIINERYRLIYNKEAIFKAVCNLDEKNIISWKPQVILEQAIY